MISSLCLIFFLRHWDLIWPIFTAATAQNPRDPFLQRMVPVLLVLCCFVFVFAGPKCLLRVEHSREWSLQAAFT